MISHRVGRTALIQSASITKRLERFSVESLPSQIVGTLSSSFDLSYAHRVVQTYLERRLPPVSDEIDKNSALGARDGIPGARDGKTQLARNEILYYQREMDLRKKYLEEYITMAEPLLQNWKVAGPYQKLLLLEKWYERTRLLYPIFLTREIEEDNTCPLCECEISKVCSICGWKPEETSHVTPIPVRGKDDDPMVYFEREFDRYRGSPADPVPLDAISKCFEEYCVKTPRKMKDIRRKEAISILKQGGFQDFYHDLNLILWYVADWPLPDLLPWREQVLDRARQFSTVYPQIPKTRTSALSTQLFILLLMRKEGVPIPDTMFKLSETPEIYDEAMRIWHEGEKMLGWDKEDRQEELQ